MTSSANCEAKKERLKIEDKHAQKIQFLVKKYKTKKYQIPEDIKKFSSMKIFQHSDQEDKKVLTIEGEPMVIDCTASSDEKCVLLLPPKFATMEDLNLSKFELETESMKAKMRIELRDYDPIDDRSPQIEDYRDDKLMSELTTEACLPYNPVNKVIDLSHIRATD